MFAQAEPLLALTHVRFAQLLENPLTQVKVLECLNEVMEESILLKNVKMETPMLLMVEMLLAI